MKQFCGCVYKGLSTHWIPVMTVWRCFYFHSRIPWFLLKEHIMFRGAVSVTRNLIKICSVVDSLLMSEELQHQEAIF
jgi:hypothetical protein